MAVLLLCTKALFHSREHGASYAGGTANGTNSNGTKGNGNTATRTQLVGSTFDAFVAALLAHPTAAAGLPQVRHFSPSFAQKYLPLRLSNHRSFKTKRKQGRKQSKYNKVKATNFPFHEVVSVPVQACVLPYGYRNTSSMFPAGPNEYSWAGMSPTDTSFPTGWYAANGNIILLNTKAHVPDVCITVTTILHELRT